MIRSAFALFFLGTAAAAQDEDIYRTLAVGDRIQVTFRNGNTITGNLVALPAAGARQESKKGQAPSEPFRLLLFAAEGEPASQAQEAILGRWMGRHPEGKVETPSRESQAEAWKAHAVGSTPTLVFFDKAAGRALKLTGVKAETDLTEALLQFRATAPAAAAAIDYAREKTLTLDVSWEYPGLDGTLTIAKDQVRAVRKLQPLDPKTLERLKEEKAKIAQGLARDNEARAALEEERALQAEKDAEEARRIAEEKLPGSEEAKVIKEAEKIKKALEIYRKFPPPEWGPEKFTDIQGKSIRKQMPSMEEREFMQNYEAWLMAKDYYEKKKGEKEEKKEPKKEPEGKKAPPSMEEKPPEEKNP